MDSHAEVQRTPFTLSSSCGTLTAADADMPAAAAVIIHLDDEWTTTSQPSGSYNTDFCIFIN